MNDSSGALMSEQAEEFLRPFFRSEVRRSIIDGQFREVFLLTERRKTGHRICVPLRASAFLADIMILEKLIKKSASKEAIDARAVFAILTAALASSGYGGARMRVSADGVKYSLASIHCVYAPREKHIEDRALEAATDASGDTLEQLAMELKGEWRDRVNEILAQRVKYVSYVDLIYKTYGAKSEQQSKSA